MNKDYFYRIIKTLAQAGLSALIVALADGVDFTNKDAVKSLIVGVIAAILSAAMNITKARKTAETNAEECEDEYITEDEEC